MPRDGWAPDVPVRFGHRPLFRAPAAVTRWSVASGQDDSKLGAVRRTVTVLSLVGVVCLAAGLFPSAVADAAVPGAAFSGTSTHGDFDVTATPECSATSPLPPVLTCSQATYLDFVATPTAKAGRHCAPYGLSFPPMKIKPNGSFSGVVDNPGNWYLTLTGRFISITAVTGTVSYRGCATDTFTVDIPVPVSTVPPCLLLSKAHAVNVISNGQPGENLTESFTGKAGRCQESFDHGTGSVSVALAASSAPLGAEDGGMAKTALSGLGPGGAVYYADTDQTTVQVVVFFEHGHTQGYLSAGYDVNAPCTPTSCITPLRGAAFERRAVSVARSLYGLV